MGVPGLLCEHSGRGRSRRRRIDDCVQHVAELAMTESRGESVVEREPFLQAGELLVIADDLAGAAESAAALTSLSGSACELQLDARVPSAPQSSVLAIDTDSRYLTPLEARARVREALTTRRDATMVIKKVDSLLRGRIADETVELQASGRQIIASFALPSMRRTVVGGVVRLDRIPLHETNAWSAERSQPPRDLVELFDGTVVRIVPLSTVRGTALVEHLAAAGDAREVLVCDAEDQSDLERVASAAIRLASIRPLALMGTGALARAVGRRLIPSSEGVPPVYTARDVPVLVVAGTLASTISDQLGRLVAMGAGSIRVSLADLSSSVARRDLARQMSRALKQGVAAVFVDPTERWHRDDLAVLAQCITFAVDLPGIDLVLTGGETARRVLEALGVATIYPLRELSEGAVLSVTPSGSYVVTRPGSFGSVNNLVEIVAELRPNLIPGIDESENVS
jgi:uncharacterized protein YgbK (DUF1537 family)